jgi:hypothetical protein
VDTLGLSPAAQRVAQAVQQNAPRVLCFACLAAEQQLKEHDVRALALVVLVRGGLRIVRRACSSCGRVDEMLAGRRVA